MSQSLDVKEQAHLRQTILSQCIWSDTYSSLKHILKRTANQLPLLISFSDNNDEQETSIDTDKTIFFFDRNVSNKLLFTPLKQLDNKQDQFEIYPRHCTFATTDLYRGVFEFVSDGQRCSRIFQTLEQLVDFATDNKCTVVFMSRDRVHGSYPDSNSSSWSSQKYSQGSIFHAQRIHRAANGRKTDNDHLECLDEDGYTIFLKMNQSGRYSLIATSIDQQNNQPEIYLHSTQAPKIVQLIERLTRHDNNNNYHNNCIRLVRGAVPDSFHCQYFHFVRQHKHDILVGLTQEGLIIEWNLESHAPCRYAINFNDILTKLSGSYEEQLLEAYIYQARTHYRESFQINMQLISTRDWAAFFQYWKWTGDIQQTDKHEKHTPYQSRHRFHLVASIQDLSDHFKNLFTEFKKSTDRHHHHHNQQQQEQHHHSSVLTRKHTGEKLLTAKQLLVIAEMNKILTAPKPRPDQISLQNPRPTSLLITREQSPFDNSLYDSNTQISTDISKINPSKPKPNARRTQ